MNVYIKFCLASMLLLLNSALFSQRKAFIPNKVVFVKTTVYDNTGQQSIDSLITSMVGGLDASSEVDSSSRVPKEMLNVLFSEFFEHEKKTREETTINISQDTIWRFKKYNGVDSGDFARIERSGLIYYYENNKTPKGVKPHNISERKRASKLTINKKDVKTIQGLECYKARVELTEGGELGNTVFEMYVTELINLPVHAIVYIDKLYPFFPLEVKTYMTKFPGVTESHQAVLIERQTGKKHQK